MTAVQMCIALQLTHSLGQTGTLSLCSPSASPESAGTPYQSESELQFACLDANKPFCPWGIHILLLHIDPLLCTKPGLVPSAPNPGLVARECSSTNIPAPALAGFTAGKAGLQEGLIHISEALFCVNQASFKLDTVSCYTFMGFILKNTGFSCPN